MAASRPPRSAAAPARYDQPAQSQPGELQHQEVLSVTYWSNGAYHRDALNQLNHFLRDSRDNAQTEMDPLLFDVLWHTMMIVGYGGSVEVLSAYRSPSSNAWLASVSRAWRATAST